MWKKLALFIILLLCVFQAVQFISQPTQAVDRTLMSAREIYDKLYQLQPGANVEVAYDLLGTPHEKSEGKNSLPPHLVWHFSRARAILIHYKNSIIQDSGTLEFYEDRGVARKRYDELKEGFSKILGVPFHHELGQVCMWSINNHFLFALNYDEVSLNSNSSILVSFVIP